MDMLRAMAMFVRVVDYGSLSAAAREDGVSATMAGKQLLFLEEHLGAKLLHRTTRRQHLTEFGRLYYARCSEILALVADGEALATTTHSAPRGRLRVTAPASFGAQCLVPSLADYLAHHPQVDVDIELSDRIVDIVAEGFEVAIRIGQLPDSVLIGRALAPYRMMLCASPAYLEKRGTPAGPEDLAGHDCLDFGEVRQSDRFPERSEWRLGGPGGPRMVAVAARMKTNNTQALRRAALQGMGIVMLPAVLLEEDVEAGRLARILPGHEPPSREMHVVYAPDQRMSLKLRTFVDFVVERFA